jgi:hypothetical protein
MTGPTAVAFRGSFDMALIGAAADRTGAAA